MMKRNQLREAIFRHLDGLVVVPVTNALFTETNALPLIAAKLSVIANAVASR